MRYRMCYKRLTWRGGLLKQTNRCSENKELLNKIITKLGLI
ncbi:MAG: hypothetical protein ACTS4X_00865 [Candidatus Hodgkinia cicadicola]